MPPSGAENGEATIVHSRPLLRRRPSDFVKTDRERRCDEEERPRLASRNGPASDRSGGRKASWRNALAGVPSGRKDGARQTRADARIGSSPGASRPGRRPDSRNDSAPVFLPGSSVDVEWGPAAMLAPICRLRQATGISVQFARNAGLLRCARNDEWWWAFTFSRAGRGLRHSGSRRCGR